MKIIERLADIQPAFQPSSLVCLLGEASKAACPVGDRVLVGTDDGSFVLVDRQGNELARAQHPLLLERADGIVDSPLSDIAAIGNRFAATYGAFVVTGEVEGDTLRFVGQTPNLDGVMARIYPQEDSFIAYRSGGGTFTVELDGSIRGGGVTTRGEPSALERKLRKAMEDLEATQEQYSDLGADDTMSRDMVWGTILEAPTASTDEIPTFSFSLYGEEACFEEEQELAGEEDVEGEEDDRTEKRQEARAALQKKAAKVYELLYRAAQTEPQVAQEFVAGRSIHGTAVGTAAIFSIHGPQREKYDGGRIETRLTDDGKVLLETIRRNGRQEAWMVDDVDFSAEAIETGKDIVADANGEGLFVLYDYRIERIDLASGARETIHRGNVSECRLNAHGQLVVTRDHREVVIVDPDARTERALRNAEQNRYGIVQYNGPVVVRDLEGRQLTALDRDVTLQSYDAETKTIAYRDADEMGNASDGKTRLLRIGSSTPFYEPIENATDVRVSRNVAFVTKDDGHVDVIDLETSESKTIENYTVEGTMAVALGCAFAKVNGSSSPRLAILSKDAPKKGPKLPVPEGCDVDGLSVMHVNEEFLVVYADTLQVVWVLDRHTLEPMGEPIHHPSNGFRAVTASRHGLWTLDEDGIIQNYRIADAS